LLIPATSALGIFPLSEESHQQIKAGDQGSKVAKDTNVNVSPCPEKRRRIVSYLAHSFALDLWSHWLARSPSLLSVLEALRKLAKILYAPGTPAGSSRNQEKAVKM